MYCFVCVSPTTKNRVCLLGFCVAMWLPLRFCTAFSCSTVQHCLPLWVFFFFIWLQGQQGDRSRQSIKPVWLTHSCPERFEDNWARRCWGEGLQMPRRRRRSRCRRRRWADVLWSLCFETLKRHKNYCAEMEFLEMGILQTVIVQSALSPTWNTYQCTSLDRELSLCAHIFDTGCQLRLVQTFVVKLNEPSHTRKHTKHYAQ